MFTALIIIIINKTNSQMKLKIKLSLIALFLCNFMLIAQNNYKLSGTVTDEGGIPILGANVTIAKTTKGAATDSDGKFIIDIENGEVLNISYIGYITQSITISGQKELNVILIEDASQLDEVVVVGYGTRKKSHSTGAIAKVGGAEVAAVQATRVDDGWSREHVAVGGRFSGAIARRSSRRWLGLSFIGFERTADDRSSIATVGHIGRHAGCPNGSG